MSMSLVKPDQWKPVGIADLEPAAWQALRHTSSAYVVAGPGAGKTEFLAQRAAYLLQTGLCRQPARILAISFKTIRVLVEATLPSAGLKQKSRWVRALEYVHSENVSPSHFRKFVRHCGGLAGCAALASRQGQPQTEASGRRLERLILEWRSGG